MLPAHLIGGRLALDEAVLRIAVKQAQLRGERPGRLAVGFLLGPEPGKIEVRIADRGHHGNGIAVFGFHQRAKFFPRPAVRGDALRSGLLKIHDAGVGLQAVGDFGSAQGILRQLVHEHLQGGNIHPQLIGILIPYAVGGAAEARAAAFLPGVAQRAGQNRPCGTAAHIRVIVARIDLKEQVKAHAFLAGEGQHIV